MIAWAKRHAMALKGHPILWQASPWGWPAWRGAFPSRTQQLEHVRAVLSGFGDEVHYWDVVNEPLHLPAIEIDQPYRLARQVAPGAHLIINEYGALADPRRRFFKLLKKALASGVPFDGIGLQAHHPDD
jgi:endo-1,4-beta-xylanase